MSEWFGMTLGLALLVLCPLLFGFAANWAIRRIGDRRRRRRSADG